MTTSAALRVDRYDDCPGEERMWQGATVRTHNEIIEKLDSKFGRRYTRGGVAKIEQRALNKIRIALEKSDFWLKYAGGSGLAVRRTLSPLDLATEDEMEGIPEKALPKRVVPDELHGVGVAGGGAFLSFSSTRARDDKHR
jgi:hypothetical protein